jgi:selenoprotein W-related protein
MAAEISLIESSGGVFEVVVDGRLVYSKKQTGEFPDEERLIAVIGGRSVPGSGVR